MGKNPKKKKEKPILSKEEKDAKKALKKKNQKERVKKKTERKEANRRKRVQEEEEDAQASPRSTASTSKKRKKSKQEETEESSISTASTSKKMKKSKQEETEERPRSTASTSKKKKSNESPISKAEKKRIRKIKKLNKLRKPLILTKEEQRRVNRLKSRKTIAWWDYENLSYPKVGAFKMIENKLRREGYTGELELHAIVGYKGDEEPTQDKTFTMHYGDLNPRPKEGTKADQKADDHMRELIRNFLKDKKRAPQNTLLITNDNGFREFMDLLRDAGHGVLLATTQQSLIIKSGSHKVWSWKYDIVQED